MAENFVLFDRWFCSVPGPTNPNRAYITSGTSHGHGKNDADFGNFALPEEHLRATEREEYLVDQLPEQHHGARVSERRTPERVPRDV